MKRPLPLWFLVAANIAAAAGFLAAWPWQTGLRGMLFLPMGIVHLVLAAGLWSMRNWARILMICYAALQLAALSVATLSALVLAMAGGLTAGAHNRLLLAALGLPLLLWTLIYLLRPAGQALFVRR